MEPSEQESQAYTIYCDRHAPLEIKRTIENKRKVAQQEIIKFCRGIEKYYESYKYKFDEIPQSELVPQITYFPNMRRVKVVTKPQVAPQNLNKKVKELEMDPRMEKLKKNNRFLREVQYELNKFEEFGNVIKFDKRCIQSSKNDGTLERVYTLAEDYYVPPKKRFLYNVVSKNHKVWGKVARNRGWQVHSVYKKYRRILDGSEEDDNYGLAYKRTKLSKHFRNLLNQNKDGPMPEPVPIVNQIPILTPIDGMVQDKIIIKGGFESAPEKTANLHTDLTTGQVYMIENADGKK